MDVWHDVGQPEDFVFDGDVFVDNYVVLNVPIQLAPNSTNYAVPTNQFFDLALVGVKNGSEYQVQFGPEVSSGGIYDAPGGFWTYDYQQTMQSGTTITIHMEGDLVGLSLP